MSVRIFGGACRGWVKSFSVYPVGSGAPRVALRGNYFKTNMWNWCLCGILRTTKCILGNVFVSARWNLRVLLAALPSAPLIRGYSRYDCTSSRFVPLRWREWTETPFPEMDVVLLTFSWPNIILSNQDSPKLTKLAWNNPAWPNLTCPPYFYLDKTLTHLTWPYFTYRTVIWDRPYARILRVKPAPHLKFYQKPFSEDLLEIRDV